MPPDMPTMPSAEQMFAEVPSQEWDRLTSQFKLQLCKATYYLPERALSIFFAVDMSRRGTTYLPRRFYISIYLAMLFVNYQSTSESINYPVYLSIRLSVQPSIRAIDPPIQ